MKFAVVGIIVVGETTVTLKRPGNTNLVVANILGRETTEGGKLRLWLDRLIHSPFEREFAGWEVNGAVSSVLTANE